MFFVILQNSKNFFAFNGGMVYLPVFLALQRK